MPATIHIIHPSREERVALADMLSHEAAEVRCFATADEFFDALAPDARGCVIAAANLPGRGTQALVEALRQATQPLCIVVLGRDAHLDTAVAMMRSGAMEYFAPPLSRRRLLAVVRRAITPPA
jgi:FixJ family two-component response regulator